MPKAKAPASAKRSGAATKTKKKKAKVKAKAKAPVLVNLEELCETLEISMPTARKLVKERGFPVETRGSNGVPYEFDLAKVARWKKANEKRLEDERAAREAELAQARLDLFGGTSIDEGRAGMSPRDQKVAIEAEVLASNLAKLRRELVRTAGVEAATLSAFTALRTEILAVPDALAKRLDLDREIRAAMADSLEAALTRAADTLSNPGNYAAA